MANQLERLISMEDQIRRKRFPNVETFCRMFEVKPRTVYEDIRQLKERFGMDIVFDRFKNGYFNRTPSKELPAFDLNDAELSSLELSKNLISRDCSPLSTDLERAWEKIRDRVDPQVVSEGIHNSAHVLFGHKPSPTVSRKIFRRLQGATRNRNRVEIEYFAASTKSSSSRLIEPYKLIEQDSAWYLMAFCLLRKGLRLFAVHRISKITLLNEKFELLDESIIQQWLDTTFKIENRGKMWLVKIHFSPEAALYIRERRWHPQQGIHNLKDGSCILIFPTLSLEEAQRWVLSYGAQAKVLEPVELADLVMNEMKSCLDNYG